METDVAIQHSRSGGICPSANICTGTTPTRRGSLQPEHVVGALMVNLGHESCSDRGEVRSNRCRSAAALLPSGRRHRAACTLCRHAWPWLCHGGTSPEKASEADKEPGRSVGLWQWDRWRLLGFWLACAMEPGRRCRSSLCFKSRCCSKVIATLLAYF